MFDRQQDLFDESPSKEMTWRERYNKVIASSYWEKLRQRFLEKHDFKCCRCGWQKTYLDKSRNIELHHKTYERLGKERDEDLELVCSVCHVKADRERAEQGRRRAEDALYSSQFDGWASKVYGDDYESTVDEFAHERFCDWQERKSAEDW
jgi:5-methylcytosine-specific restriction endonuclease McrA